MATGVVTKYVFDLIAKQVEDHRLVVWYDPEQVYSTVAEELKLPRPSTGGLVRSGAGILDGGRGTETPQNNHCSL